MIEINGKAVSSGYAIGKIFFVKKDNIDMIKLDMPATGINTSTNKIFFSSKNSANPLQITSSWSTSTSGKAYVIQTPYSIAIYNANTGMSSSTALIISKTQLNTLGVYYRGGSSALSYGFDNIVIDPISPDQFYQTSNAIMTQMLPLMVITPSSNEYMSNVYSIIKSQGVNNSFREVRLGLRNFITDGKIAFEI